MDEEKIRNILLAQITRYPKMGVEDLYKLIHQAAMGSEHAVRDPRSAREWLLKEVDGLGIGPDEPLIDEISADGQIVRIHLRPFIQNDGDLELLLRAFVRTANEFSGNADALRAYYSVAEAMSAEGELPFLQVDLLSFLKDVEGRGFPAVHHSPTYEQAYKPAYRVIARDFL